MSVTDFGQAFARRTHVAGGNELATILAGSPPGVLSMTGGFPNPATFPTGELDEIADDEVIDPHPPPVEPE